MSPLNPVSPDSLQQAIGLVFNDAQKSTSSHRKIINRLRNVFQSAIKGQFTLEGGTSGREGEKQFCMVFMKLLSRVLLVSKKEIAGDRCLRFVDAFIRVLLEKDNPQMFCEGAASPQRVVVKNSTYRLVVYLLRCLLPLLPSREKSVRYRVTQLLAILLTNTLSKFPYGNEPKLFIRLKIELIARMHDKEAAIRAQSAIGLSRLLTLQIGGTYGDSEIDAATSDDAILAVLIEVLQNDPNAETRRSIIFNLPLLPETLPYLLERSRDVDPITRRSIFSRILPGLGDFRSLSNGVREKILRWGLTDRDELVQDAARKMFNFRWLDDADGDILEVLERLHLPVSTPESLHVKQLAMKYFWDERSDLLHSLEFDASYWEALTPEAIFLVKSFSEYCKANKNLEHVGEEKMPEVTRIAFYLQSHLNTLMCLLTEEVVEDCSNPAPEVRQRNALLDQQFIVQELLSIALAADYGDEIGRRKMFALMRDSLALIQLPDVITKMIVQVLARISLDEKHFCMLALEVIAEIQDELEENALMAITDETTVVDDDTESFHSALSDIDPTGEERSKKGAVDSGEDENRVLLELSIHLKCLFIAQCMLENVHSELMQNAHLVTMLNGLVVPAVRSHEASIRELGLRCLGLSCLLNKSLAEDNLTLFVHCFNKGHESLQIEALQIISDCLMVHGPELFSSESCAIDQKTFYRMLTKALRIEDAEPVQTCAAEVMCKLMLAQVIQDSELLRELVIAYFEPNTAENEALRQTLSYFLPVYSHSRPDNQYRMQCILLSALEILINRYTAAEIADEMVSPAVFTAVLVDWTDPRKNLSFSSSKKGTSDGMGPSESAIKAHNGQFYVASEALSRCLEKGCGKELRKAFISLLPRLYVPLDAPPQEIESLVSSVEQVRNGKFALDSGSKSTLSKFAISLEAILSG